MPPTLGQNIQAARIAAGLTQAALAERVHVSVKTISAYECDKSDMGTIRLGMLAFALSTTAAALLKGVELPEKGQDDE